MKGKKEKKENERWRNKETNLLHFCVVQRGTKLR
jgi:hypothetical protein